MSKKVNHYDSGIDTYSNFLDYISGNTGFDFGNIKKEIKNADRMNDGSGMTNADIQSFIANQFSAERQMDFQRDMANTQWQRGVADMQAAGINPALAYSQGGAAAPSGQAASSNATVFNGKAVELGFISNLVGQFMELAKMPMEMYEQAANIRNMYAQNENLRTQNILIGAQAEKTQEEARGIAIENKYKERKEAGEARNIELTADNIIAQRDDIIASMNVKKEQAKTEVERQSLIKWEAAVQEANKNQVEALTPELVKYQKAATENQRIQAGLAAVKKAQEQKLLDSDYFDNMILSMEREAREKFYGAELQKALADLNQFKADLRSGRAFQLPADWKQGHPVESWFVDALNGMLAGISGISEAGLGSLNF